MDQQPIRNKKSSKMERLKKWKKMLLRRHKSTKVNNDYVPTCSILTKCKSYPPWDGATSSSSDGKAKQRRVTTPGGCFSVYVGSEKQRFVIKTKYASHPLFKALLDDAEKQFGFSSEGPLVLPCDVNKFYKVLAEMDCDATDDMDRSPVCGGYGSFSYARISPSKSLLKLNELY